MLVILSPKQKKQIENNIVSSPCRFGSEARTPSSFLNQELNISSSFFPLDEYKISLGLPDDKSFESLECLDFPEGKRDVNSQIIYVKTPQTIKNKGLSNKSNKSGHYPTFGIDEEDVSMEIFEKKGYLLVKSTSLFHKWQKHFFVVTSSKLYWAQSEEAYEAKTEVKCVSLLVNPCKVIESQEHEFSIELEGLSLILRLRASSLGEAQEWIDFLKENYGEDKEDILKGRYILCTENILKADIHTEEIFLENVQTGDILLFRANHIGAKLQRFLTYSDYDHVALLLKSNNDVFIFDAVYENGVQLTSWIDFKKNGYYNDYPMIASRKLTLEDKKRFPKIEEKLWDFVSKHVGKKYELGFSKIFRRSYVVIPENGPKHHNQSCYIDKNDQRGVITERKERDNSRDNKKPRKTSMETLNERDPEEGFFCSELVAEAYKCAGLLDESISSVRYLPVSFSQRKKLNLLLGASLSHENGLALINEQTKK